MKLNSRGKPQIWNLPSLGCEDLEYKKVQWQLHNELKVQESIKHEANNALINLHLT